MAKTEIGWTDYSWNPIKARRLDTGKVGWHCERVSPACTHCYAAIFNGRNLPNGGTGLDYVRSARDQVDIFADDETLQQLLHWKKPRRIFVCSMTDLFAEFVQIRLIDRVFAMMALTPRHTYQLLTKRPDRMREYLSRDRDWAEALGAAAEAVTGDDESGVFVGNYINGWSSPRERPDGNPCDGSVKRWPLPNVWVGATVEDQHWAEVRLPDLVLCPAAVRFISYEPALGALDLSAWMDDLQWVIAGGESGRKARPSHPDWFREVRDQCGAAGVPFFFKQHGEWCPFSMIPEESLGHRALADHRVAQENWCQVIGEHSMHRLGKGASGRLLDGVVHGAFPEPMVMAR